MSRVNKNQLILDVANRLDLSDNHAKAIINEFCKVITDNILDGNEVSIKGLFTVTPRVRRGKEVQNFSSGQRVIVSDRTLPYIKISRRILDKCKKNNYR